MSCSSCPMDSLCLQISVPAPFPFSGVPAAFSTTQRYLCCPKHPHERGCDQLFLEATQQDHSTAQAPLKPGHQTPPSGQSVPSSLPGRVLSSRIFLVLEQGHLSSKGFPLLLCQLPVLHASAGFSLATPSAPSASRPVPDAHLLLRARSGTKHEQSSAVPKAVSGRRGCALNI